MTIIVTWTYSKWEELANQKGKSLASLEGQNPQNMKILTWQASLGTVVGPGPWQKREKKARVPLTRPLQRGPS